MSGRYVVFTSKERPKVERLEVVGGAPNPKAIAEELQERWSQLSESKRVACHDEAAKNKANNFSAKTMFKGSFAAWAAELAEAGGLGRGTSVTLKGLKSAPEHNDKQGTVLAWMADKGRYKVQLGGAEPAAAGGSSSPGVGRLLAKVKAAPPSLAVRPINLSVVNLVTGEEAEGREGDGGVGTRVTQEWVRRFMKPWLLQEDGLFVALMDKSLARDGAERPLLLGAGMEKEALASLEGGPSLLVAQQRQRFFPVVLTDGKGCAELSHHTMVVRTVPTAVGQKWAAECPDLDKLLGTDAWGALAGDRL